jgi:hypothetical protein
MCIKHIPSPRITEECKLREVITEKECDSNRLVPKNVSDEPFWVIYEVAGASCRVIFLRLD